jgi:hypothetical protein
MEMPPVEWLFDVSSTTLADLELAELDRGSRRLKAAKAEWNAAVGHFAKAEAARYLRDHRLEVLELAKRTIDAQALLSFPEKKLA